MNINQVSEYEFTATDPISEGTWKVLSEVAITKDQALLMMAVKLMTSDCRPAKDNTITINNKGIGR